MPNKIGGAALADMGDVMLALGRLQEGVDRLREDFTEEKASAAQSRKSIYEKHDALAHEMTKLKSDVVISAQIGAQTRNEVQSLVTKVDQNKADIQPSLEDWRRIKNLGLGITGVLALGGVTVGAFLSMGVDAFKAALRQWLGG